jgi:hypothetical protein
MGVVVMPVADYHAVLRGHILWQCRNDPAFVRAWVIYMRENALIRGYPRWVGYDGAWTPTEFDRVHPQVDDELLPMSQPGQSVSVPAR